VGVEDALVRLKSPGRDLYDTGFTMNVLRAGVMAVILFAIAGPVGHFFKDTRLTNVLLALAVGTFGLGFTNIGTVDFRRKLTFNREFQLLVLPRVMSVTATLVVAVIWRSYWALVVGGLVRRTVGIALSYAMHPYRPRFTLRAWRGLVHFSAWTWVLSTAMLLRDRTDVFFIGWWMNPAKVGLYAIGNEIADLPTTELVGPLAQACFAGFAATRHTGEDSAHTYLRVIAMITLVTFPSGLGISLLADPVVRLALGPRWVGAIPIVEVTALFCTTTVFGQISYSLLNAHAMLSTMFRITFVSMVLRILLLVLLIPVFGLLGAVFAAGISMVVEYSIYVVMTFTRFGLKLSDFVLNIWRSVLATAVMGGSLSLLGLGWTTASGNPWALAERLLVTASLGAVIYTAVILICWVAVGRPPGAESDLLNLFGRVLHRFPVRLPRRA
ncbi:MAG: oligosaccharide flippase family protein, partial [Acetobacteraceae bacterium]